MKRLINFVGGCQDTALEQQEATWEELCILLSGEFIRKGEMTLAEYQSATDERRKSDKDGPAWIPCSVFDQSGRRSQANMDQAYLLVLDIDTGMSLEDVKARIAGYEAVIHSSYSHSPDKPKWRVVFPLDRPIPASEIGKVFDCFQDKFEGLLDAACGHDPSRLYYLPACPDDAEGMFVFEHIKGQFLAGTEILKQSVTAASKVCIKLTLAHLSKNIGSGVAEGGRNNDTFRHACRLFEEGLSAEDATAACLKQNECNTPPLGEDEVKKTVTSAQKHIAKQSLATSNSIDEIVAGLNLEYAWVEKQGRVYRFLFRDFVHFDQLRQQYANTGLWMGIGGSEKWLNHAEIWHRSDKRRTHANVSFIPGGDPVVENCINLWDGWGASPAEGDLSPWNELLEHLFSRDMKMRRWFEQWLAYPLQYPGAKLSTAAVLWSKKQGVGKSLIGETIGKIYGSHFRTLSSAELHGSFNGWMRSCQFALGEENSISEQRADANRLKFLITGLTISVNEKHQPAIELPNCANFLFTSNHADAFYLEDADRRFFIWEISDERKPDEFYKQFVYWRDNLGGLSALMYHLMNIGLTDFNPKGNAPETEAKHEMIRQSKSDIERWLSDNLEDSISVHAIFGKEVAYLEEISDIYSRERRCRTTTTAMSRALQRTTSYVKRRITPLKARRRFLFSLINHEKWDLADNLAWQAEYDRPTPVRL